MRSKHQNYFPVVLSRLRTVLQNFLEFDVLTKVVMNVAIFWDTAPCSPYMNRCFVGMYHRYLQDRTLAEQETRQYSA
jgi:hypothetical protein